MLLSTVAVSNPQRHRAVLSRFWRNSYVKLRCTIAKKSKIKSFPPMSRNPKKRSRAEAGVDYHEPDAKPKSKRLHEYDVGDILGFLDAHSKAEPLRKRAKRGFKFKMPPPFSLSTQALVIFLRFGTIHNDRKTWLSPQEVLLRTGVRTSAQSNIIRRWRQRGYVITSQLKNRGRKRMLTWQQVNYLKNPKILQEWSHLSLEERAARMREKFDLPKLSASTLRDYYHRSKVR